MSSRNSSQLPDETMATVKIEGMLPNELCCERGTLPRAAGTDVWKTAPFSHT